MHRVSSRVAYRNPWLVVREDQVLLPDGSTSIYGVVEKPDFALVLPREADGFWLVQQFRYPVGRRLWEFPQGSWSGAARGSALDLARAELAEETGLRAEQWTHLGRLVHAQGLSPTEFDVYLAEDLSQGETDREATESDMIHARIPDDELDAMISDGRLADSASLAALTLYRGAHRRQAANPPR
jgi:8-oxo-dGTP pyrophosphatase MutT (NUDIX family)